MLNGMINLGREDLEESIGAGGGLCWFVGGHSFSLKK
jgi:hypothetical protein